MSTSISASLSPEQHRGDASQGSPESAAFGSEKGVLSSLNLNFFKSLSEKRTTRNANPPKRRGPKPDSKPALTRRQELNRQAQRTHRERKELYIKALEDEVLRLKEVFSNVSQDKQKLADENRRLKEHLNRTGLQGRGEGGADDVVSNQSRAPTSTASFSGKSYAPDSQKGGYSPPLKGDSSFASMSPPAGPIHHQHTPPMGAQTRGMPENYSIGKVAVDLEQAGIDFVLTLERPCMAHLPFLLDRTRDSDGVPCGHALMASCPPVPFDELTSDIPFERDQGHDCRGEGPAPATWELSRADLTTLLHLSQKLNLDGEITPVMAWGMVLAHSRSTELASMDYERLAQELSSKIRCYGFGAVMEEFELRDAMENVLSDRVDVMEF